ncbi:MAG: tol-pal system-associated acyl-CoA thioesterase [Pseudomonadota bacterium]
MAAHRLTIRVYYEDTDLAGIVYYANYLKFIERGRTEALRAVGIDQARLRAETGAVFVVRRLTADYRRPARFDEVLTVETRVATLGRATLECAQTVLRDGERLFEAAVGLAVLGPAGTPIRLPAAVVQALGRLAD